MEVWVGWHEVPMRLPAALVPKGESQLVTGQNTGRAYDALLCGVHPYPYVR